LSLEIIFVTHQLLIAAGSRSYGAREEIQTKCQEVLIFFLSIFTTLITGIANE